MGIQLMALAKSSSISRIKSLLSTKMLFPGDGWERIGPVIWGTNVQEANYYSSLTEIQYIPRIVCREQFTISRPRRLTC
jgi:hypothetical protein